MKLYYFYLLIGFVLLGAPTAYAGSKPLSLSTAISTNVQPRAQILKVGTSAAMPTGATMCEYTTWQECKAKCEPHGGTCGMDFDGCIACDS